MSSAVMPVAIGCIMPPALNALMITSPLYEASTFLFGARSTAGSWHDLHLATNSSSPCAATDAAWACACCWGEPCGGAWGGACWANAAAVARALAAAAAPRIESLMPYLPGHFSETYFPRSEE